MVNIGSRGSQNAIGLANLVTFPRTIEAKQCSRFTMPKRLEKKTDMFFVYNYASVVKNEHVVH